MTNFTLSFPIIILSFGKQYEDRISFFIVRKYINLFFRTINQNIGVFYVLNLQYFHAVQNDFYDFFVYLIFFAISGSRLFALRTMAKHISNG